MSKIPIIKQYLVFIIFLITSLTFSQANSTVLPPGAKGLILFDEAHNPYLPISSSYSQFAAMLQNDGYIVDTLGSGDVINASVLNEADVLVITAPTQIFNYTSAEHSAIKAWLQSGGSLLIISGPAEYGAFTNDLLWDLFGYGTLPLGWDDWIYDTNDYAGGNQNYVIFNDTNILSHAITQGVSRVEMYAPSFFESTPSEEIPLIKCDTDGTAKFWGNDSTASGVSVISAFDSGIAGTGRLVVYPGAGYLWSNSDTDGDGTINLYDSDNEILASNIIEWLTAEQLPTVSLTYPNGGEMLSGTITISWTASDPDGDSLTSDLFYWNGSNWIELIMGLTSTSYDWDTMTVPDGANYKIRVIVNDGRLSEQDESDAVFTIDNPHAPIVTVIYPNGGETLMGFETITWTASDADGDSLHFNISYWDGSNWIELITGLTSTSYDWDTLMVLDGNFYQILVNASDGALIGSDTSDASFTINNPDPPVVTVLYPNGGEMLMGIETVTWTASDADGDPLTYNLSYWDGSDWVEFVKGLTETSYDWDTRTVPNGDTYQILVNASDGTLNSLDTSDNSFTILNVYPIITGPSDFPIFFGSTGRTILWTIVDDYPSNYTVYRNNSIYQQDIDYDDSIIVPLDGLQEGKHNFTCVVQNIFGRRTSDEVWVTVLPLTPDETPPWISSPDNISFEEGNIGYSIVWSGSDDRSPWWSTVWENETKIYDQAWIGNDIEISLDNLTAGTYKYNCTIYDEAGNYNSSIVFITVFHKVPDSTQPTIIPPNPIEYEEGSTGHNLTWYCSDDHPYAFRTVINGTELLYSPWRGENITTSVDGLDIGIWVVTLTLWDLELNNFSASTTVTVFPLLPDITSPTISHPADLRIAENIYGIIIWEVYDENPQFFMIHRNGTLVLVQDYTKSGLVQYYFTSLPLGTWEFTLTVWDQAGNNASSKVLVRVVKGSEIDIEAPLISQQPDVEFSHGTIGNSLIFYIFDEHPKAFSISQDGVIIMEVIWVIPNRQVIYSLDGLDIGSYVIVIKAWDIYDQSTSQTVHVTVTGDNSPPTILLLPDYDFPVGHEINITWVVSDDNPSRFEILLLPDGGVIKSGSWSGEDITLDLSEYSEGTYHFRCVVYDVSGNFAFDDVTATITKAQSAPGFEFLFIIPLLLLIVATRRRAREKRRFYK
ncbi:MAG: Ig-like domain-containing protein [Promethearchaeota archaeon]